MPKAKLNEELIKDAIQFVALGLVDVMKGVAEKFGDKAEVELACSIMGDIMKADIGQQDFTDAELRFYGVILGKAMAGDYNIKDPDES